MSRSPALALAFALALAGCASAPPESPLSPHETRALSAVSLNPAAAEAQLNAYRASRGLGPVRLDPQLTAMAQTQADAMAAAGQLSHDVAGSFTQRLGQAHIGMSEAAENVGAGYYSLEEAMSGWRGSAAHDANLRLPNVTRLGIALAKNPATHYGAYWAMELASEPRVAAQ